MIINKGTCFLVGAGLLSSAVIAGTQGDSAASRRSTWPLQASLQLGGFWASQGKAQHIAIDELIGDDFSLNKHTDFNGLVGLGMYLRAAQFSYADLSCGINAFYLAKTSVNGTVTQEQLFTNLAYGYDVTNWPIYFGTKADIKSPFKAMSITVDAGIGPNLVSTSHFRESSLDGGITEPDHIFSGRTRAAFSAAAGIGLKFSRVFGPAPLECGYRFFYLGQGNFTKLTDQVVNTLSTGDGYAHALLCSITV